MLAYRSMVMSLNPRASAISSYKPIMYLTHPRPRNTSTGLPVELPKSEKLTCSRAFGERLKVSSLVNLGDRRKVARACFGSDFMSAVPVPTGMKGDEGGAVWTEVEKEDNEGERYPPSERGEHMLVEPWDVDEGLWFPVGERGKERAWCKAVAGCLREARSVIWTSSAMESIDDRDTKSLGSSWDWGSVSSATGEGGVVVTERCGLCRLCACSGACVRMISLMLGTTGLGGESLTETNLRTISSIEAFVDMISTGGDGERLCEVS